MNLGRFTLTIDGAEAAAEDGQTVLEAARASGIYIPTLCSHPDLTPQGGCKLCVVEIEGLDAPVTSCTTAAAPGMVVSTKGEMLSKVRTLAMELILASHPADCTSCPVYLNCELQAMIQYIGATHSRLRTIKKRYVERTVKNPLIVRDMERCVQCGRCVRACSELRDIGALAYNNADGEPYVSTCGDQSFSLAKCRYCGACVEVCPTGALRDIEGAFSKDGPREKALVPCRYECPAHIDVPAYLRFIAEGKYGEAVGVIREKAPFPLALGYVCTKTCEVKCRREKLNEPISIKNLKRHAVENDDLKPWERAALSRRAESGKRVAVVGSGPAGLTAAYYLSRLGHEVEVRERMSQAGGMMRAGIPTYRLPREALDGEIGFILKAGVSLVTGSNVGSAAELLAAGFEAVVVATGAHAGRRLGIPGADLAGVWTAVDFLRGAYADRDAELPGSLGAGGAGGHTPGSAESLTGRRVAVLGGGNVAFDCARTARRLGAASVGVLCLEPRGRMLADKEEVEQAEEEGVEVLNGKTFDAIEGSAGTASGVRYRDVRSFSFDAGRLTVDAVPGSEAVLAADAVIFAAGQFPDLGPGFGLELLPGGFVKADAATMVTSSPGVFVAGDAMYGTRSVIKAIESGREAARSVDLWLGGDGVIDETFAARPALRGKLRAVEGFDALRRLEPPLRPAAERLRGFAEAEGSLERGAAKAEADRCLQCDLRLDIREMRLWGDYAAGASDGDPAGALGAARAAGGVA